MGALVTAAADFPPDGIKPEPLPFRTVYLLPDDTESLLSTKWTLGEALFN